MHIITSHYLGMLLLPSFLTYFLPSLHITSDYLGMLYDQELVDTVFDVDGTLIRAHRIILASRSAYFRAMFASTCREVRVLGEGGWGWGRGQRGKGCLQPRLNLSSRA